MQNSQDIQPVLSEQELQMQIIEGEQEERQLDEYSQKLVQRQEIELEGGQRMDIESTIKPLKNPVSPYMVFISHWKSNHPQQKFNVSTIGEMWRSMGISQKQPFETEYKEKRKLYEEYLTAVQLQNPNATPKEGGARYLFPLQRVRAIMRQDTNYAPKTEAIAAMSKSTELFADYLMEEVKRMSQGKNRIDYRLLYDCINNVRPFSFLESLIQDHNLEGSDLKPKKGKPEIRLQMQKDNDMALEVDRPLFQKKIQKSEKKVPLNNAMGQMSLDMFMKR